MDYEYAYGVCDQWRLFKQLNLKEKKDYAKRYKSSHMIMRNFVNEVMLPEMIGGN